MVEPPRDSLLPRQLKVLLVDDDKLSRELLATLLTREGHRVVQAAEGVEALAQLRHEEIDVVFSDVLMPSMDGYQLCHKIRKDERFKDIPVIICSGACTTTASEMLAAELGAVRFLRKPFTMNAMLTALEEAVKDAEAQREISLQEDGDPTKQANQNALLIHRLEEQNKKLLETTEQLLHTHHELLLLARQIEDREEALRKKNQQLEEELLMARETQLALLPKVYPSFPKGAPSNESALRFYHRFTPKGAVGGDFLDVAALADCKAGVFICDVMGHGVRAALVTAVIRGLLSELSRVEDDPGKVLTEMNRTLVPILRQVGTPMFASAFYLIADARNGRVRFANAGHPTPLLLRPSRGVVEPLGSQSGEHGPALGLIEETDFPVSTERLEPGDLVMLLTDGIFEADGPDSEPFGQERVAEFVKSRLGTPVDELFDGLVAEVHQFSSSKVFDDDVCMLGMQVDHFCPA